MDFIQILFDEANTLAGGIFTDTKTLFLASVVLLLVLVGLGFLKNAFDSITAPAEDNESDESEQTSMRNNLFRNLKK